MKKTFIMLAVGLIPLPLAGQEDATARLAEVLPADVSADVLQRIEAARAMELPSQAMAVLALEGVAKGRSGAEVLAAVELLAGDMSRAQEALRRGDRAPGEGEVEAATAAMRMGVDGDAVSALARSQPSGRALTVPLLVVGGLVGRGLPSDDALAAVQKRLSAQADDEALLTDFSSIAADLDLDNRRARAASAGRPGGPMSGAFGGFDVSVAGVTVPVGRPAGARRPGGA